MLSTYKCLEQVKIHRRRMHIIYLELNELILILLKNFNSFSYLILRER